MRGKDEKEPRFDISWINPPSTRDPDPSPYPGSAIVPVPPQQDTKSNEDQLLKALQNAPNHRLYISDLAAKAEMEFVDTLRSVVRLVARRKLVIEQRDPLADDHLVRLRST
jgi:hypothetical protein